MAALIVAAQQVALGEADVVMALGLESLSNAPHILEGTQLGRPALQPWQAHRHPHRRHPGRLQHVGRTALYD